VQPIGSRFRDSFLGDLAGANYRISLGGNIFGRVQPIGSLLGDSFLGGLVGAAYRVLLGGHILVGPGRCNL